MSFKISSVLVLPLAALFTGSLFLGCSIREDRNSCPCVVRLDVEEAVARAGSEVLLMVWNQAGELIRRDTLPPGTDWWSFGVERGAIRFGLYSSLSLPLNDGSIVIPRGADCPEVLLDVVSVDASGELLEYHADFQKHVEDFGKFLEVLAVHAGHHIEGQAFGVSGHVNGPQRSLKAMRVAAEMVVALLQAIEADRERA